MSPYYKTEDLINIANIPDDNKNLTKYINDKTDNKNKLINYYKEYTDINPVQYTIKVNDNKYKFENLCCIPRDFQIKSLKNLREHFSNYSYSGLKLFGLHNSDSWNGDIVDIQYNTDNNSLEFSKTDYYSFMIHSGLLKSEFLNACDMNNNIKPTDLPLRNKLLSSISDLYKSQIIRSLSCTTIIFGFKNNSIYVILLTRSKKLDINPNSLSTVGGAVEYDNIKDSFNVSRDAIREFKEELFNSHSTAENVLDGCNLRKTCSSWNLNTGGLNINYSILLDEKSFNMLLDNYKLNFEHTDIDIMDIRNIENILELINNNNKVSSSFVSNLMESIKYIDNNTDTEFDFNIERSSNSQT